MNVEQPPRDTAFSLSSYLTRMFTKAFEDINRASAAFLVRDNVKNPVKGKLYLVESDGLAQFSDKGLYYYDGVNFTKLAQGSIATLSLGTTHDKAYYGDFGNAAYLHSQEAGNAHDLDFADAMHTGLLRAADWAAFNNKQDVLGFASATADGILKKSDWSVFRNKQDALGFTPENVANKVIAWSSPTDTQYPSAKLVNDTFANYLPLSSYHLYYKGKFTTLAALTTAIPVASPGDYAQVDAGIADNVVNYSWDEETGWVIGSSGSGATNTDGLPEGSTNFYFTEARVRATLLTGFSITTGTISSTDSVLTAFNKLAGNVNTKISIADIHAATNKTTPVDADEFGIYDSVSGLLNKLTWANLKATLKTYFDTLYPAGDSSAWTSWTPTLVNITVGNGTLACTYKCVGKTMHYRFQLTAGSTTSIPTASLATVTLPEALSGNNALYTAVGDLLFLDASANLPIKGYASFRGNSGGPSKGVIGLYIFYANGTYAAASIIQSGIPATIAAGDIICITGTCEIA